MCFSYCMTTQQLLSKSEDWYSHPYGVSTSYTWYVRTSPLLTSSGSLTTDELINGKSWEGHFVDKVFHLNVYPDSRVHGANMGSIWGRQAPDGPNVGPMNFAIWVVCLDLSCPSKSGSFLGHRILIILQRREKFIILLPSQFGISCSIYTIVIQMWRNRFYMWFSYAKHKYCHSNLTFIWLSIKFYVGGPAWKLGNLQKRIYKSEILSQSIGFRKQSNTPWNWI